MAGRFYGKVRSVSSPAAQVDQGLRSYMCQVYTYMGLGLGLTGAVAFLVAYSPLLQRLFFQSPLLFAVVFGPVGIALFLGGGMERMSASGVRMLFWIYAALMGVSLSSILLLYTEQSIARVFFVTAATFGAMSLYGYTTNNDLSEWRSFLYMGLIGVCLASLFNLFFHSSALQFALSVMSVLVFTGLTAYDTQRIMDSYREGDIEGQQKTALWGAFQLYLDFINILISLMRLMGERK